MSVGRYLCYTLLTYYMAIISFLCRINLEASLISLAYITCMLLGGGNELLDRLLTP